MVKGSRMATKDISDLQVCIAARDRTAETLRRRRSEETGPNLIERLMAISGQCEKVCCCAAYRAAGRGLIDYGVSVRHAWPTEKGNELIAALVDTRYRNLFNSWLQKFEG